MIDTLLQALALVVLAVALIGAAAVPGSPSILPGVEIAIGAVGLFAITSGYFIVFEILWSGQTPGKRLLGLRVLRESGYPLRPVDAVVRNLVRILDWLPLGYGIGVLVMLLNQRSKRLGDFAAGTLVVREGVAGHLSAIRSGPHLATSVSLSSADSTLVRDFLVRRDDLDPVARAALAQRLATALARRYGISAQEDAEAFLERLTP